MFFGREKASEEKKSRRLKDFFLCAQVMREKLIIKRDQWRKTQCLKIKENVSFSIASETIYVYILSRHKLIKKIQSLRSNSAVLPDTSNNVDRRKNMNEVVFGLQNWFSTSVTWREN